MKILPKSILLYGNKKDYHHQGLGTKLFKEAEGYAAKHYKYLQVKTVDEGHYSIYDQTICFYESLGFSRLEVFQIYGMNGTHV